MRQQQPVRVPWRQSPISKVVAVHKMVGRSLWNIASGLFTRALTRDKAALADVAITRRHVWKARSGFLDIDLNLHLNNSSYLYNMELARWHMTGYL